MIKYMKLMTGDEIVGTVEERGEQYYVKWPLRLSLVIDPEEEKPKVKVEPFASQVKGHSFFVDKTKVLYVADPVTDLQSYYESTYGNMVPRDPSEPKVVAVNEN